jgi:hypothetical protein
VATRFSVSFSDEAYETLEDLAERKGISKVDVLRDSLALEKWLDETRRDGGRILVERQNGSGTEVREVLIRD